MRPDQLAANLQRGLVPVYLVAGEEPLLLQECCDQIRQAAKEQGFVERELLQVERGFDWALLQQVAAPSLFATQKMIDLRLRTGKPGREGSKALTEWAAAHRQVPLVRKPQLPLMPDLGHQSGWHE